MLHYFSAEPPEEESEVVVQPANTKARAVVDVKTLQPHERQQQQKKEEEDLPGEIVDRMVSDTDLQPDMG